MYYSESVPRILEEKSRLSVAKRIFNIIKFRVKDTSGMSCLDIGCASGVITNYVSKYFRLTIGVDTDPLAIDLAKKKYRKRTLSFYLVGQKSFGFSNSSFDVIICNQVYEFVDDQKKLAEEIYRLLRKGGICFLGARNKFAFLEGQTHIPLLHFLPSWAIANLKKVYNINYYPAKYLGGKDLKKLFENFLIHDITYEVLKDPGKFGFTSLKKYGPFFKFIPKGLIYPFIPNYLWLLEKK